MRFDSASKKNKMKYIKILNTNSQKYIQIYMESLFILNECFLNLIFYSIFNKTLKNDSI